MHKANGAEPNSIFQLMWVCISFDSHRLCKCKRVNHKQPQFDLQAEARVRIAFDHNAYSCSLIMAYSLLHFSTFLDLAYSCSVYTLAHTDYCCFITKGLTMSTFDALANFNICFPPMQVILYLTSQSTLSRIAKVGLADYRALGYQISMTFCTIICETNPHLTNYYPSI